MVEVDTLLSDKRVVCILERLVCMRGLPESTVCDKGPADRLAMQGSQQSLQAAHSMSGRITAV